MDEEFQELYKEHGLDAVNYWDLEPDFPCLSKLQLKFNLQSLMGALETAIVGSSGKAEILKYKKSQDGLGVWLEMVDKFDKGGNRDNRIRELETIISTPYSKYYKGGIKQFLIDYENAFMELTTLGEDNWNKDAKKIRRLNQNLHVTKLSFVTYHQQRQNI